MNKKQDPNMFEGVRFNVEALVTYITWPSQHKQIKKQQLFVMLYR